MPKLLYRGAERLAEGHELLGGVGSLTSGLVVGNIRIRLSFTVIFCYRLAKCATNKTGML